MKSPLDAVRDGLSDYGWKLLLGEVRLESPGRPGFWTELDRDRYVRVRVEGEHIVMEADHFSVRLPPRITAAIASIVLRTIEAGREKLPALHEALASETSLYPPPRPRPKRSRRPKKGGAGPGETP